MADVRLALLYVLGKQIGRWKWRNEDGISFSEIL